MPGGILCRVEYRAGWDTVPRGIQCRVEYHVGFMRVRGCVEARWGLLCAQDVEPGVRYKMVWLDNGSDDIAHKCVADGASARTAWPAHTECRGGSRGDNAETNAETNAVFALCRRAVTVFACVTQTLAVVSRAGSASHKGTKSKTYPRSCAHRHVASQ